MVWKTNSSHLKPGPEKSYVVLDSQSMLYSMRCMLVMQKYVSLGPFGCRDIRGRDLEVQQSRCRIRFTECYRKPIVVRTFVQNGSCSGRYCYDAIHNLYAHTSAAGVRLLGSQISEETTFGVQHGRCRASFTDTLGKMKSRG
jgi:hypothetical protein